MTVRNASPAATILWPTDAATAAPGVLEMRGTASDPDDVAADLEVTWRVDGDVACPAAPAADDDSTACSWTAVAGTHRVALEVFDPDGAADVDALEVTIDAGAAPSVTILSPEDGARWHTDEAQAFAVMASDAEDPATALSVTWSSDVAGDLWTGTPDASGLAEASLTLGEGRHVLTASVADSDGNVTARTVDVLVLPENTAPTCEILHPTDGARYVVGDTIAFRARVSDAEQDAATLAVRWSEASTFASSTPSASGLATAEYAFDAGDHEVTVQVADDGELRCADTVTFRVGDYPSAEILDPVDGVTVDEGDVVDFEGLVGDPEDGAADLTIRWRSSVDGVLWAFAADSAGTTAFSSADLSAGTHTITLEATDSDGLRASDTISLVVNGAPSAPAVSITPDPASTDDDLVVRLDSISVDPEGSPVTYRYEWSVDGVVSSTVASRLPASLTTRGEAWSVRVIPSDGRIEGVAGSASITIGNTAPSLRSVAIDPEPLYAGDTAACRATGFSDADGDADATAYAWTIDGVAAGSSSTLTGFVKGDTVTCTATPSDGTDDGTPLSYSVIVANSAPSALGATITPSVPKVGDTVTCAVSGFADPDGDADSSRLAWTRNGAAAGSGSTFAGTFVGGDTLSCTVTPSDGEDDGSSVTSSVTVGNSAPSATSATITPDPAYVTDALTCTIAGFSDPDGDADLSTFAWRVGSVAAGTGATLSSGFAAGDTVTCSATPSDGTDSGAPVTASVTIRNSAPKTGVPSLTPASAYETSTLTCAPGTTTDADGTTAFSYTIAWTVGGATLATTATTLDGASFSKGDAVSCAVTASDGTDTSAPKSSSTVTILNSPPTATVSVTDPLRTADTARASVTTADADGDAVTVTYAWTVDAVAAGAGSTLSGSAFDKGDAVAVRVTPSDGTATGAAATDAVTVSNTAPSAPIVSVDPSDPIEGDDDLWCRVDTAATDADGDALTYTFAWTVDSVAHGTVLSTTFPGDTVDGADTAKRETWTCSATATDGADTSAAATASVRILGVPVDYGHLQYPCTTTAAAGSSFTFYGWIYHPGVTPGSGRGAGITVEGGYGPDGSAPTSGWTWTSGSYNGDKDGLSAGDLANDEYMVTIAAPSAGTWDFGLRASTDGGLSWLYIDEGGYCGGNGTRDGYSPATAGSLVTY